MQVFIRNLHSADIIKIVEGFNQINWNKPQTLFETYLAEENKGERLVWVAYVGDYFAGYITLKWQSNYQPFLVHHIPEIKDLNVLPQYRNLGIASQLLTIVEQTVAKVNNYAGLGLYGGLDGGYGPAQKLYIKRGYIPDGRGITYKYQPINFGLQVTLDDDLILWFTKYMQ